MIIAIDYYLIAIIIFPGTNGLNENERIVVASVAVFMATSIMFFFIGFLCGHFCRKQNTASADPLVIEKSNPPQGDSQPGQNVEELELQTNVAYGSVFQQ